jgi:pimeloyl-ACP methyl ester carboxylesterase
MSTVQANGIKIEYDTFGDPSSPPVLLIMGLGVQMTMWDSQFCQAIAERGYFVIRFDNRDVGLSTWFDDTGISDLNEIISGNVDAPYSLTDMSGDAVGLLNALGISSAHIVGASMGGMIAQTFAIENPAMTRTLTSIMSTTGDPSVGQPSPEALAALTGPTPTSREEAIENRVRTSKAIGSPNFPEEESRLREYAGSAYDRSFHPSGQVRQFAAIISQPNRTQDLQSLDVPTLVIHGADDPLVNPSGGRATADAIPNAKLKIVPAWATTYHLRCTRRLSLLSWKTLLALRHS